MRISIVVVMEKTSRAIGLGNKLLWRLPEDTKRFVDIRMGKPVIMGRKTWESLPEEKRPLKGSHNIVVTRNVIYGVPSDVSVVRSIADAIGKARDEATSHPEDEILIMGGAQLYKQTLPIADRLYVTFVDSPDIEADTFFPEFEKDFEKWMGPLHILDGKNKDISTEFVVFERKQDQLNQQRRFS